VDTIAIQRSLTILEDRYRELREMGEKHRQTWETESTSLRENLADVRAAKDELERELGDVRVAKDEFERELGEGRVEKEGLERELAVVRMEKEGLERELGEVRVEKNGLAKDLLDAREEEELLLMQLHQVQEELQYYFLENQRILKDDQVKDEKLAWLRGQRKLLLRMLGLQSRLQQRFMALDGRIALPSMRRQLMPWWQRLRLS
jgi:chromosome segregation ATPase